MATLATILFTFAVLSVLTWVLVRVRGSRHTREVSAGAACQGKKGIDWSVVAIGVCFSAFGIDAAVRGEAEIDLAHVSGTNVRMAGALLCIIGLVLIARSIAKRNENRA